MIRVNPLMYTLSMFRALKITFAVVNSALAIYIGGAYAYGLLYILSGGEGSVIGLLYILILFSLVTGVVCGWIFALGKTNSILVKILSFIPVMLLLYTLYIVYSPRFTEYYHCANIQTEIGPKQRCVTMDGQEVIVDR